MKPGAGPSGLKQALHQRWHRTRHSLGARLTALFLLLGLAMTLTFLAGMQAALRYGWQDYARPLLAHYVDTLAAEIGTPPSPARAQALAERLPLRIRIEGPTVNWSSHPSERFDAGRQTPERTPEQTLERTPTDAGHDLWRPQRLLADGHRLSFGLASPLHEPSQAGERPRLIGWATLGLLLLLLAGTYWRVRRLLHPLADIRAGALRFGRGDFSAPIVPRRPDELGELAQHINQMAEGLHGMLDAKRQLLLAISHELRSPLTRARLNAELVAEGPARDALLQDLAEMRDLITDLLESERLAAGHSALQLEPTDLNALLRELAAGPFQAAGIEWALDPSLPRLLLDPARLRLLLRNLIGNALRHGSPAALPPRVSTHSAGADGDSVVLCVRDHGPGVGEAQLPLLAQAFYRADSARLRSTGGVGLGLHLCQRVAQAHGGELLFRRAHPGLEVELRLPARQRAA